MDALSEQRQTPRLAVSMNVVLAAGSAYFVAETENVSESGLRLRTSKAFPVGTHHKLVFGLPPDLPKVSAEGVVKWSDNGKGVGVEFTFIDPNDKPAFLKFLNSHPQSGTA